MMDLYRRIENLWFSRVPRKVRYVFVGGFNTIVAYLIFAGLYLASGKYGLAIVLQYMISINLSILTMRHYVFRSRGKFRNEYFRAAGVYMFMLCLNYVSLSALVELVDIEALRAQVFYMAVSTVVTYLLHKYFSFRVS